jgi:hypothetical protein
MRPRRALEKPVFEEPSEEMYALVYRSAEGVNL